MKSAKNFKISFDELSSRGSRIIAQQSEISFESFGTDPTVKSEFESKAILKEKQDQFLKAYAEKAGC